MIKFVPQLINLLATLILLLSFAMIAQRRIVSLINLFMIQGAALVAASFLLGYVAHQPELYISGSLTLVLKVVFIPWMLHRLIRKLNVRWDVAEKELVRILEIAGFHAAAGGSGYTSLESGRLGRFDLSPLLPLDRAVLVGRGPAMVDWRCQPQSLGDTNTSAQVPPMPGQAALWRIVIPLVRPVAAASGPAASSNGLLP